MVFTTIWWFGRWFTVVLPTLRHCISPYYECDIPITISHQYANNITIWNDNIPSILDNITMLLLLLYHQLLLQHHILPSCIPKKNIPNHITIILHYPWRFSEMGVPPVIKRERERARERERERETERARERERESERYPI